MTTDLFGTSPAIPCGTASSKHHGRRALTLGIAASAALALFLGGMAGTASAAPPSDTVPVNVTVDQVLTLTMVSTSVELNAVPGTTSTALAGVEYNVQTNNEAGYEVNILASGANLTSSTAADVIPIGSLEVRTAAITEPAVVAAGAWQPLSDVAGEAVMIHTQAGRSVSTHDTFFNDFQMEVPFVETGVYTTTLTYTATAL